MCPQIWLGTFHPDGLKAAFTVIPPPTWQELCMNGHWWCATLCYHRCFSLSLCGGTLNNNLVRSFGLMNKPNAPGEYIAVVMRSACYPGSITELATNIPHPKAASHRNC